MSLLDPTLLSKELEAASVYFSESAGIPEEKKTILEQIAETLMLVHAIAKMNQPSGSFKTRELELARDIVQNFQLVKIAETGSDFFGRTII